MFPQHSKGLLYVNCRMYSMSNTLFSRLLSFIFLLIFLFLFLFFYPFCVPGVCIAMYMVMSSLLNFNIFCNHKMAYHLTMKHILLQFTPFTTEHCTLLAAWRHTFNTQAAASHRLQFQEQRVTICFLLWHSVEILEPDSRFVCIVNEIVKNWTM